MDLRKSPGAQRLRAIKTALFAACLMPLGWMVMAAFGIAGLSLGANPVEALIHEAGLWGLRLLLLTLAVTPLRRITGWNWLIRLRRMLGLFAFFYVFIHFLAYAIIDQRLALGPIVEDIIERPFITIGIAALLLLLPLAITSTNAMMRRLGRRWQQLHRLIYPIAILGVWHFWWQVKQDIREPLIYAAILALLLGFRIWSRQRRRASAAGPYRSASVTGLSRAMRELQASPAPRK
ncbi:MAG: protein-methionine-sulfoxide reductase heme-binding subunit MsrQ [Gammaproteobacteria bacterium]